MLTLEKYSSEYYPFTTCDHLMLIVGTTTITTSSGRQDTYRTNYNPKKRILLKTTR